MLEVGLVNVHYTNNIKHNISEQNSRPITGSEREALKDIFKRGEKPLNEYLKRRENIDSDQIISGNNDGFGKDTQVFRQIATESRKIGRYDKNVLLSMIQQMEEKGKSGKGFIRKISAKPNYILYWSEEGLNIYHKLAKDYPLYWDATGSVVRKNEDGKRYLYYELAIKNPVNGKMGIPLTSMISDNQSLPIILDWLTSFQHAEKKRFGHNNIAQPKLIVSDEAWVFMISALRVFNTESLQDFLERSWQSFIGKIPETNLKKTIVHLCASHFMNKVKRFCNVHYKKNMKFGLYLISLLMNSKTFEEAEEILHDICITLQSPTVGDSNRFYIERLLHKINKFDTAKHGNNVNVEDKDDIDDTIQPGRYTEDNFLTLATDSPFKRWGRQVNHAVQTKLCMTKGNTKNPYHSELFLNTILTKYLPIFPLWATHTIVDMPFSKTQSTIENRFRILKSISLDNRKNSRMDDFSKELQQHTVEVQRLMAKDALKTYVKKKTRKSTTTIEETWNKKQFQTANLKRGQGNFQRAPDKFFSDFTNAHLISNKDRQHNGMRNLGSTCWFNSMMQALNNSDTAKRFIDAFVRIPQIIDNTTDPNKLFRGIIRVLEFMANLDNSGKDVPRDLIFSALQNISEFDETFKGLARQQDVNEFYTNVISKISKIINEKLIINQEYVCEHCQFSTIKTDEHIQEIELHVPENNASSISTLITEYFQTSSVGKCSTCSNELSLSQHLRATPKTLIITLKRYKYNKQSGLASKIDSVVAVDKDLDLSGIVKGNKFTEYSLKSVICHHGRSYNSGHYTTYVFDKDGKFSKINDLSPSNGSVHDVEKSCYMLLYDIKKQELPVYIEPLIKCLTLSKGMKMVHSDNRHNDMSLIQKQILQALKNETSDMDISEHLTYAVGNNTSSPIACYDFVMRLLDYIFNMDYISNISCLGAECFKVIFELVRKCKNCDSLQVKKAQTFGLLSIAQCNPTSVVNLIKTAAFSDESTICNCQQHESTMYTTSLPHTLVIFLRTTDNVLLSDLLNLDLTNELDTVVPMISKVYGLSSVLARYGSEYVCLKRSGDNLLNSNNQENIVSDLSLYDDMLLFFDLRTNILHLKNASHPSNFMNLLKNIPIPKSTIHNSADAVPKTICKPTYWLSSDDINMYMNLLAKYALTDVYFVDSGWVSHRLFITGSLNKPKWAFFETENRKKPWANFTKVFLPVNIENRHWILIVIDFANNIMYYCDPLGNRTSVTIFQVLRYISYDTLVNLGKIKHVSDWKICYYCESKYFPKQTDGSSCGIYICEIAKAILFDRRLPVQNNLSKWMRHQVAREVQNHRIEY